MSDRRIFTLARLVAPLETTEFRREYWKRKPFMGAASPSILDEVFTALGSTEVAMLLGASPRIMTWTEELAPSAVSIETARYAYENHGSTLYFDLASDATPCRWTEEIGLELGERFTFTSMFAVRGGRGSPPHYDRNENFTIQLKGRKRWIVAENAFVDYPTTNWTIGDPSPRFANPELTPDRMPSGVEYLLEPGSIFYVPRGYLHHVTAVDGDESLSLNMNFVSICLGDVIVAALRNNLLQEARFRRSLTGVFGEGWGRDEFDQALSAQLQALVEGAACLTTDALLELIHDPDALWRLLTA